MQKIWIRSVLICLTLTFLFSGCSTQKEDSSDVYDVIIKNGRIVDGAGNPWFRSDVGIRGKRVVAIGDLREASATHTIDAKDHIVCPGFIDIHSHASWNYLVDARIASKVTQGITLEVEGEGHSVAPMNEEYIAARKASFERFGITPDWRTLADYFKRLEAAPATINFSTYVGTGTIREIVIGTEDRPATEEELSQMERLTAEAMEDGALGVFTALMYVPDRFNRTEELIAMAKVAARYNGAFQIHQRSEGDAIFESLEEVFRIAREADIRTNLTHLKSAYLKNWGKMPEVVRRISAARREGLDIVADLYPYVWGHAGLIALLPPWARIGTSEEVRERLSDNSNRERIKKELVTPTIEWENEYHGVGSPKEIVVVDARGNEKIKHLQGMSLAEIAAEQDKDPRDVLMDLVKMGGAGYISHITDEDDLRLALIQEWSAFGTDGEVAAPDGPLSSGLPHPRGYGTFPKILGRYVREWKILSLEEAIRKSTSLTAQRLGVRHRGLLREGFYADIVIFDPETIIDKATYENPHQYSEGIDYVLVNGEVVVDHGRITNARPGMVVRGPGYSRED